MASMWVELIQIRMEIRSTFWIYHIHEYTGCNIPWSCKFAPTPGKSIRIVMSRDLSTSSGPMPDNCRIVGVKMAPDASMTSFEQVTFITGVDPECENCSRDISVHVWCKQPFSNIPQLQLPSAAYQLWSRQHQSLGQRAPPGAPV